MYKSFQELFSYLLQKFLNKFLKLHFHIKREFIKNVSFVFFKRISCVFRFQIYLIFLTQAWAFHSHIYPIGFLYVRVFVSDQEVITRFSSLYWGEVGGCSLDELVGSCCALFLREQVRDLRVQEFLRELVIGVATPSDLGDQS